MDERTVRVKKKKKNGCSKNIRICVEPGLTAPGFPRILTVNYLSKKDSRRLRSSVLVMLEKMAKKKKKERAELLPNGKANKQQTYHSTEDSCS